MSENDQNKQNLKIDNSQVGLRPIHLLALAHPSFLLKQDSTLAAPNAYHKILTPLSDLTADCLHLLMYFFYLIQHCAQQVHHTAVPLSPISSPLQKSCLQNIVDNQLSHVAAFSGAPHTLGLLLRTTDIRPKQLTCIATSGQMIISACEDFMNIYDPVTGVLQQSIHIP